MTYIGRFAPSPTGPLHFGSLIAALGSWLDARAQGGQWLLRIEDLDPPREVAGADQLIISTLQAHGLDWDGAVVYQSERLKLYESMLDELIANERIYGCQCTRRMIREQGGYHRRCETSGNSLDAENTALRVRVNNKIDYFDDVFHGRQPLPSHEGDDDFILKRKDGLHAYMLAVVVDDIEQGISHIIRGADLLDTTGQQIALFKYFNSTPPIFGHLPMAVKADGFKLSKQTHAPPIENSDAVQNLLQTLAFLHQPLPDKEYSKTVKRILKWAVEHWDPSLFKGCLSAQAN